MDRCCAHFRRSPHPSNHPAPFDQSPRLSTASFCQSSSEAQITGSLGRSRSKGWISARGLDPKELQPPNTAGGKSVANSLQIQTFRSVNLSSIIADSARLELPIPIHFLHDTTTLMEKLTHLICKHKFSLVENFSLPLGEERAVTLEPTPLQPKGSVMSFGAQTLEEVDRS